MLGYRMNCLRKEKGLTLKELGDKLNLGESTMSMYENGKRSPGFDTVIKLSEIFGVSTDYLLGKTDTRADDNDELVEKDTFPHEFTDVKEARSYIDRHQIFGLDGFNPDVLDDDEILEFANALLEQMRMVSYKYKR